MAIALFAAAGVRVAWRSRIAMKRCDAMNAIAQSNDAMDAKRDRQTTAKRRDCDKRDDAMNATCDPGTPINPDFLSQFLPLLNAGNFLLMDAM